MLCAEGLRETRHPHATIARLAFSELAALDGAGPLEDEHLRLVMVRLRDAMKVQSTGGGGATSAAAVDIFERALAALVVLAAAETSRLAPQLHLVLPPIGKKMFSKSHKDAVQNALRDLEKHGGSEVQKVMRQRNVVAGVT